MRLAYITNARIPSERANAVQTVQMCAAFAGAGAQVRLYHPARRNPGFEGKDIWDYYGVPHNFESRPVPCLDLYPLSNRHPWVERLIFTLQTITFALSLVWLLRRTPADIYYSRDPIVLAWMALLLPARRRQMMFEAHTFPVSRSARAFRRWILNRIGGTVAISHALERLYAGLGAPRLMAAPDGVSLERFNPELPASKAREALGLPHDETLVLYTGGLYAGRGLEELIRAVRDLDVLLVIVGGKEAAALARMKSYAVEIGSANVRFEGYRPPTQIPIYLAAADILAMPYSRRTVAPGGITTDYMSPLKMFEYMAAGRPIVASDLPALREVLNDRNALLAPPDDADSLARGLRRLLSEPELAARLAAQARSDVAAYTWDARARSILAFCETNR